MELRGRIALVTGAGRRVGRAIAVALGEQGMHVVVHFNRSSDGAEETVAQIVGANGSAHAIGADLANPDAITRLVDDVVARHGAIDALVNSAAEMRRTPFGGITALEWDAILDLNLRAPFLLTQACAPALRRTRGAVVDIADLAAFESWPEYLPHGVSKSGIVYLTRALARVLAPEVRVDAVAPGAVLLPEGWSADAAERLRQSTPLQRVGDPSDVASAVVYLLGAGFVTGETLIVDGGRHVRS